MGRPRVVVDAEPPDGATSHRRDSRRPATGPARAAADPRVRARHPSAGGDQRRRGGGRAGTRTLPPRSPCSTRHPDAGPRRGCGPPARSSPSGPATRVPSLTTSRRRRVRLREALRAGVSGFLLKDAPGAEQLIVAVRTPGGRGRTHRSGHHPAAHLPVHAGRKTPSRLRRPGGAVGG